MKKALQLIVSEEFQEDTDDNLLLFPPILPQRQWLTLILKSEVQISQPITVTPSTPSPPPPTATFHLLVTPVVISDMQLPSSISTVIKEITRNVTDSTEMLKYLQRKIISWCDLDIGDLLSLLSGNTKYITVDREKIFEN